MSRSFYRVYARAQQKDAGLEKASTYWNLSEFRLAAGHMADRVRITFDPGATPQVEFVVPVVRGYPPPWGFLVSADSKGF
jgi:hypothetical protein